MPCKHKNPYRHNFNRAKYKVSNWHDYNEALKKRGDITIWFDDKAIRSWYAQHNGKPGEQSLYSNVAIETAGIIRLVFHLPYRQTEGFMKSLIKLMGINIQIPNYSTLSRRLRQLAVRLSPPHIHTKGTHIIIDGSGLSVYGADEFYGSGKLVPISINVTLSRMLHSSTKLHKNFLNDC